MSVTNKNTDRCAVNSTLGGLIILLVINLILLFITSCMIFPEISYKETEELNNVTPYTQFYYWITFIGCFPISDIIQAIVLFSITNITQITQVMCSILFITRSIIVFCIIVKYVKNFTIINNYHNQDDTSTKNAENIIILLMTIIIYFLPISMLVLLHIGGAIIQSNIVEDQCPDILTILGYLAAFICNIIGLSIIYPLMMLPKIIKYCTPGTINIFYHVFECVLSIIILFTISCCCLFGSNKEVRVDSDNDIVIAIDNDNDNDNDSDNDSDYCCFK